MCFIVFLIGSFSYNSEIHIDLLRDGLIGSLLCKRIPHNYATSLVIRTSIESIFKRIIQKINVSKKCAPPYSIIVAKKAKLCCLPQLLASHSPTHIPIRFHGLRLLPNYRLEVFSVDQVTVVHLTLHTLIGYHVRLMYGTKQNV